MSKETIEEILAGEDDRPVSFELPEGATIQTEQFHDALGKLAHAAHALAGLAEDLSTLRRTGLVESDLVDLIYGRNSTLAKGDIDKVMEALETVHASVESGSESPDRHRMLVLLTARVAATKISTVERVFGELRALRDRYASKLSQEE